MSAKALPFPLDLSSEIQVSVVIPAFNEEALLPRLLETLSTAAGRYVGGPEKIEVIVADNLSTDSTAALATAHGCRVVRVEKRTIAAARNGGAKAALGQVFCFVDADTQVHPETFNSIERALKNGDVVAGATGVQPERWSLGIAMTWAVMLPGVWLTGMDTGVVFCQRADLDAVGGYDENLHCAEDVKFLFALKRLGWRTKRRLCRLRATQAVVSMRKFDEHGDWHHLTFMARMTWNKIFAPQRFEKAVRDYWYDAR